jgi:hypothetical protein
MDEEIGGGNDGLMQGGGMHTLWAKNKRGWGVQKPAKPAKEGQQACRSALFVLKFG